MSGGIAVEDRRRARVHRLIARLSDRADKGRLLLCLGIGGVVWAVSFAVYLRTLHPSIGDPGDSAELQLVIATLGVPHPPGYPLYTLLGRLFLLLPVGSVAYRINLMSAFFGSCTVATLFGLCLALSVSLPAAVSASLIFAASGAFWSQAVITEVYTLNTFLMCTTLLLLILWRKTRRRGFYSASLAVCALSFGHHASVVLLLPGLLWFVWRTDRRVLTDPKAVAPVLAFFALSSLQYLTIYLRARTHPLYCDECPDTWHTLWTYLTSSRYRGHMLAYPLPETLQRMAVTFPGLLVGQFGWWGLALGAMGFVRSAVRRRPELGLLGLLFVADILFGMTYDFPDFWVFLLPAHLVFASWIGLGLDAVQRAALETVTARSGKVGRAVVRLATTMGMLLLAHVPYRLNYVQVDQSNNYRALDYATRLLSSLEPDAAIVGEPWTYLERIVILYMQSVEGLRPDVELVPYSVPELAARFNERPMILLRPAPNVGDLFILEPVDSSQTSVLDFLMGVPRGRILALAAQGDVSDPFPDSLVEALRDFGVATEVRGFERWSHAAIGVQGAGPGSALEQSGEYRSTVWVRSGQPIGNAGVAAPVDVLARSAGRGAGNLPDIIVDGVNVSRGCSGYNLTVLDADSGEVESSICFDLETLLVDNVRSYRIVGLAGEAVPKPTPASIDSEHICRYTGRITNAAPIPFAAMALPVDPDSRSADQPVEVVPGIRRWDGQSSIPAGTGQGSTTAAGTRARKEVESARLQSRNASGLGSG